MSAATEPVIEIENVSFSYDGLPVLENVNLIVNPLDYLYVLGPNGGGKTTLLKVILGLLQPTRGRVRVFGHVPHHVRGRFGYVPQHHRFDVLFPVRVLDVVLMGRLERSSWLGPYRRADKRAAMRALEEVELTELRYRPYSALSGGQRQRVLIARALVCDPDLLLLDEPMASVDIVVGRELSELLRDLTERMTIVLVTHDLGLVSPHVKKVVCVNRRVIVHPTSDITAEIISEIYGGHIHMVRHDHEYQEENG